MRPAPACGEIGPRSPAAKPAAGTAIRRTSANAHRPLRAATADMGPLRREPPRAGARRQTGDDARGLLLEQPPQPGFVEHRHAEPLGLLELGPGALPGDEVV